jgi:hypothetical protein
MQGWLYNGLGMDRRAVDEGKGGGALIENQGEIRAPKHLLRTLRKM